MDITKMSIEELKAMAFDEMQKIQIAQNNLQLLQEQIAKVGEEEEGEEKSNGK